MLANNIQNICGKYFLCIKGNFLLQLFKLVIMCLFFLQLGPNQVLDDVLMNLYYNANVKENNVTSFCGQ